MRAQASPESVFSRRTHEYLESFLDVAERPNSAEIEIFVNMNNEEQEYDLELSIAPMDIERFGKINILNYQRKTKLKLARQKARQFYLRKFLVKGNVDGLLRLGREKRLGSC
jgi:hypothetical protein